MAASGFAIDKAVAILKKEVTRWPVPAVGVIADEALHRPFEVLVSTVLSLRTKDAVTLQASRRLLEKAKTPLAILALTPEEIEKLIYPACFYKTKARSILKMCRILEQEYAGQVPKTVEELVTLPGVGRKTANLVVTVGFGKAGICVDTHVHRICNRWGYVKTKIADETEMVLREKLPKKHWMILNDLLVAYGQNLCTPLSPWCSQCRLRDICQKVGVVKSR